MTTPTHPTGELSSESYHYEISLILEKQSDIYVPVLYQTSPFEPLSFLHYRYAYTASTHPVSKPLVPWSRKSVLAFTYLGRGQVLIRGQGEQILQQFISVTFLVEHGTHTHWTTHVKHTLGQPAAAQSVRWQATKLELPTYHIYITAVCRQTRGERIQISPTLISDILQHVSTVLC